MSLILDRKSIDIMKKFINGKKGGAAELWRNKDQDEQVAQLTVIATGFINLKPLEFQTFSLFHF